MNSPSAKADLKTLAAALADGDLTLEPLEERHLATLKAACAEDPDIWEIMPLSMLGDHFAPAIAARRAVPGVIFAVVQAGAVIGITSYLRPDPERGVVEIGGTYIVPRARSTGVNGRMKRLMIQSAFASGFSRIEFRIDERHVRSQAAVLKLGARREALIEAERITWTGHVRNTCLFGLTQEDWI